MITQPTTVDTSTRTLLTCGVAAGPAFATVAAAQMLTRDGYDLSRHPISLLSTGAHGWVQIANFVLAGSQLVAFAVGMRRTLRGGRGATWAPRLMGAFGVGLVLAGVFVTDPENGFPLGTPAGPPAEVSWHAVLHGIGPFGFDALIVACFVLARRFYTEHGTRWTVASVGTGVVLLALLANPAAPGLSLRMAAGALVALAYTTALAVRLRQQLDEAPTTR